MKDVPQFGITVAARKNLGSTNSEKVGSKKSAEKWKLETIVDCLTRNKKYTLQGHKEWRKSRRYSWWPRVHPKRRG